MTLRIISRLFVNLSAYFVAVPIQPHKIIIFITRSFQAKILFACNFHIACNFRRVLRIVSLFSPSFFTSQLLFLYISAPLSLHLSSSFFTSQLLFLLHLSLSFVFCFWLLLGYHRPHSLHEVQLPIHCLKSGQVPLQFFYLKVNFSLPGSRVRK